VVIEANVNGETSARLLSKSPAVFIFETRHASIISLHLSGDTTLAAVSVAVSPHLFRTCAASTAAMLGGANPYLATALLHHTHPDVTNTHYNRATSLSAAENFRQVVRQYQKND
jgi:hypothetical protein